MAGLLLWALPCAAQLTIGNDLHLMKGYGSISTGYSGSYGDSGQSSSALNFGGNGNFNGFFYNPAFVSFSLQPYYNQSRDNSSYLSTFDSSGVNFTGDILKQTNFPGSISYNKSYNSNGTFGNPGLPSFTTHGNTQGMGIAWSALLPGLPPLTATYSQGTGTSSIYGTKVESVSNTHIFGLRTSYKILGFPLNASYNRSSSDSKTPELLSNQQVFGSTSSADSYGISTSHSLPLQGSISASINRMSFQSNYLSGGNASTTDFQNASIVFRPLRKMAVTLNENYNDNLAGFINQSILTSGGVPHVEWGSGSHNLNLSAGAGYPLFRFLAVNGNVVHVSQSFAGKDYQATYVTGVVSGGYGRKLFGLIDWSVSMVDNATQAGNSAIGMMANADISHTVKRWNLSGSFNYAENVQTLLVMYTSSYYRYTAQVSHRFGKHVRWSGQFGDGHSVVNGAANSGSSNETLSSSLGVRWLSASATYSKMTGSSILTVNGLQDSPVLTPLLPVTEQILYGGSNYSFSLMGTPIKRFSIGGVYTKSASNTSQSLIHSANQTEGLGASLSYQMRKLGLRAGFSKASQSISAAGIKPNGVTSYYFGVNRHFRLF